MKLVEQVELRGKLPVASGSSANIGWQMLLGLMDDHDVDQVFFLFILLKIRCNFW
jgi:hypothetical protein